MGKIINDGNDGNDGTRPHAVQRKRLFDNSDELFAADQKRSQNMLNESINPPPKNPKIQALTDEIMIDEIINDSSLVKPQD